MCLPEFAAYHCKDYKTDISETIDAQAEVLTDDIIAQLNVSTIFFGREGVSSFKDHTVYPPFQKI